MKPLTRAILTPIAVLAMAGLAARLFFEREEGSVTRKPVASLENIYDLRASAVEAAKNKYQVMLEAERITYEQEKKDADVPELAELGHEVRLLRIELEHKSILAAIDKKYPPPFPKPELPIDSSATPIVP